MKTIYRRVLAFSPPPPSPKQRGLQWVIISSRTGGRRTQWSTELSQSGHVTEMREKRKVSQLFRDSWICRSPAICAPEPPVGSELSTHNTDKQRNRQSDRQTDRHTVITTRPSRHTCKHTQTVVCRPVWEADPWHNWPHHRIFSAVGKWSTKLLVRIF